MSLVAATISGSFRRFLSGVAAASETMWRHGVTVLSPLGIDIRGETAGFLHLVGDRSDVVRVVQDGHLAAIAASDLLWLVTDGYVGPSAAMEIGWAVRCGVPIYSDVAPSDVTLREYIRVVDSIPAAIRECRRRGRVRS